MYINNDILDYSFTTEMNFEKRKYWFSQTSVALIHLYFCSDELNPHILKE